MAILTRGNPFVRFVLQTATVGTFAIGTYILASRIPFVRSLQELIFAPLLSLTSYLSNMGNFIAGKKEHDSSHDHKKKEIGKRIGSTIGIVIRSILISIPILGILLLLLANADPIFAKRLQELFDINWETFLKDRRSQCCHSRLVDGYLQ